MSVEYLGKVNGVITVEKLKELTGVTQGTNTISGDITFLKFSVDGRELLVADRCIAVSITWNHINSKEIVFGKNIDINNINYNCRIITGSTADPSIPDNSEWKKLIVDLVPNDDDSHWKGFNTICQETHYKSSDWATVRGAALVDTASYLLKSSVSPNSGWRPVLEKVDSFRIDGVSEDLNNITSFRQFNYTITNLNGGNFNLTEKVDGKIIRTLNDQSNGEFTFNVEDFDSLIYGNHTIEIIVDDPTAIGNAMAISKFNKVKSPINPIPTNSNLKQVMLHNKELEKEISYQNFRLGEKLKENGIEVAENESLSSIISKVEIGKRWAEGSFTYAGNLSEAISSITVGYGAQLDFTPSKIFLEFSASKFYVKDSSTSAECVGVNYIFYNTFKTDLYAIYSNYRYPFTGTISNITGSNFALTFSRSVSVQNVTLKWYAFE